MIRLPLLSSATFRCRAGRCAGIAAFATTVVAGSRVAPAVASAPASPPPVTPGEVVALQGTPHLWIADQNGTLHWAGDTRALAGKTVDWSTRLDVSLDTLKTMPRGDPWLSAGLVKDGDPIYLVKWETNTAAPALLHIQSIADVELFGINASNYGAYVLDRATWEQRYNVRLESLARSELVPASAPAATPTPTPAPQATATPASGLTATLVGVTVDVGPGTPPTYSALTTIEVTGAPPRTRLMVSLSGYEYDCSPGCSVGRHVQWGPTDAFGDTNGSGYLKIEDRHMPYANYTYTIVDATGRKVTVHIDDDMKFVD
jgi:hypothetical protein